MSTCSSMGVHLSIKKKKKTFISWLLWEQRNRANRAMEQWVFSKHNRCLPLFFNSIFFPPLAPLSLALSMVARHFWIHEYIYIYIYSRSTARILSIGLMRPGLRAVEGEGESFSNICSMVYENWKIESPGSPPIFFHLADNWAARAAPPIFEPSDIVWVFIWCPSVDRCATD